MTDGSEAQVWALNKPDAPEHEPDWLRRLADNDPTLTRLATPRPPIGESGARGLATALASNTWLKSIDLTGNHIGESGAEALAKALASLTSLTSLDLSYNSIGNSGAVALARALASLATLTSLNLSCNSIGDSGAAALATALDPNTMSSLESLDLLRNRLRRPAVVNATTPASNTSLTSLDLAGNRIGDRGATALATALASNTSLKSLDLSHNSIGEKGAASLATAFASKTSLTDPHLHINSNSDSGAAALATTPASNTRLSRLSATVATAVRQSRGQHRRPAVANATAAPASNTSLTSINLAGNRIGDRGAAALATALASNTSLTSLDLSSNPIGESGAAALATALGSNAYITSLSLACSEQINVDISSALRGNALERLLRQPGHLVPLLRTVNFSVGPPATGKSAMRLAASGQRLDPTIRTSTRGAEILINDVAVANSHMDLEEPFALRRARRTRELIRLTTHMDSPSFFEAPTPASSSSPTPPLDASQGAASHAAAPEQPLPTTTRSPQSSSKRLAAATPKISETFRASLLDEMLAMPERPQRAQPAVPDTQLQVTFFDLGGQRNFESVLLPFIRDHGVYLAFLRLDEALAFLDGLPPPPSSELAGFDHSPFDALIAWLTTICARSSEGSIFLVCPFLDAIEEDREQAAVTDALRRISDTIATRLGQLQHPARPRLVHNGGLVIWPLNNADAASNRAEPMQALLAELTTHWRQSPAANQLVPLPTVLLIDRLRLWAVEYDRSLASLSDVVDLFHSTIDSATLEFEICDMLDYLHQLGLVTFFREHPELRKVVVLDQRWLLDQMTRVIRKPAMHRLTDDSGGDLDTALLMSHPDEWADLYHSCTSDCGPGCAKGGRLHPSLLFALLPDFSEAECRQHLALMIKFGLAVAVGTPEAELYIVPPLLPRSRPNAPHPPPSPCAPLALALHFRSDICGSSLDFVNGADLRDRNHLPLGLLEQLLAAFLRRAVERCASTREARRCLSLCSLSTTHSRIAFSADRVLILALDKDVGIITLQLESGPASADGTSSPIYADEFADEMIDIATTVCSTFFSTLGEDGGASADIHLTPLVQDVRDNTFVKLTALRSKEQAALPTAISAGDFHAAFDWLLPDPAAPDPNQTRSIPIVVGGTLGGAPPLTVEMPFYLPPAGHPSPEASLWQTSDALLRQHEEHRMLQEHTLQQFWADFEPALRARLGNESRLAALGLAHLAPYLRSIPPLRAFVGGSASTGTVLSRADWDVLVNITAPGVCMEQLPDNKFKLSSPTAGHVELDSHDLRQLGKLYIDCFREFVRANLHDMRLFLSDELGADTDDNLERVFNLPAADSTLDSFTLRRLDAPVGEDLADVLPAIPASSPDTLFLVPGASPTKPTRGRDRFLALVEQRRGLLQLAAVLKQLLRRLGVPSCAATRLAYDVGMKEGWPKETALGRVWPMSVLVKRGLQLLVDEVERGRSLPPLTGPGDLLTSFREGERGRVLVAEVRRLKAMDPLTLVEEINKKN